MESLTEYMKKEIIFYIKQERDKGIPLSKIKKSLLEGGHHTNLVKEAMRSLKKHDYNLVKALNEPIKSQLDKELYFNIMNSLVKYVEYQLSSGKKVSEIKKILSDYGHSKDIIEKAINGIKGNEPKTSVFFKRLDIIFTILIFSIIFLVSGTANEPLELVLFGFIPTILTIVVLNVPNITKDSKMFLSYMWLFPLIFSLGFLLIGIAGITRLQFEFFRLTILNLALSITYTYIKSARIYESQKYIDFLKGIVNTASDKELDTKNKKTKKKSSPE